MGPAVATQILLQSKLNEHFELLHVDTNVHASLRTLGTWGIGKAARNARIYAHFAAMLRKEQPALVLIPISQTTLGFLKDSVFILLSRLFGRRTLLQLRGSNFKAWLDGASEPVRTYVEATVRTTQGAIVLGERLRYLFAEYFPEDQIFVVPNGADYQFPRHERLRDGGPVRVLYLANLMRSKGIEDVLMAACLLKARGADFRIDVVGAWLNDETERRCRLIMERGRPPVTFHPGATGAEKLRFFAEADLFVFPPRATEGHPWVTVEALAAGLPIVATDQGAITEGVLDGTNGFIVEPCHPQQIADRLQRLIEHPQLRAEMGRASRQHYLLHFTEEKMVERLACAMETVLSQ